MTKPANVGSVTAALAAVKHELSPKIKALCPFAEPLAGRIPSREAALPARRPLAAQQPARLVAIGVSTDGPNALLTVLRELPGDFPTPIAITQHMPPVFTRYLAERPDAACPLAIREARDGDLLRPDAATVAPGDYHLSLTSSPQGWRIKLHPAPPENSCRPAVDVMFRSVAEIVGPPALAVMLTGMGQDGLRGSRDIRQAGGRKTLNIWSAACSSGQEPYSIAILLREHFPQLAAWNVRIHATDLSREMLRKAAAGEFNQLEVNRGLPAHCLVRYFTREGLRWTIQRALRETIAFSHLNLTDPWAHLPTMDVVFMRNVLIYFTADTKRQILAKVHRQLAPDGVLFLGGAETTLGFNDQFQRVAAGKTTIYRPAGGPSPRTAP